MLPELITEGDTLAEALANAEDAFAAVVELYEDRGRPLPSSIYVNDANGPVSVEAIVSVPLGSSFNPGETHTVAVDDVSQSFTAQ